MSKPYLSVDSFCGAGGLSYGLHLAGFEIAAAFDLNEMAIQTFKANVSDRGFQANIQELTGKQLTKQIGLTQRLDLFAGGPPCQGFSKQKRGAHLGDERNNLVLEYARLVRELKPRTFMLENVDQLGMKRGRDFLDHVQQQLKDYVLYPRFYNSADFGVAQTRPRFITVGVHKEIELIFQPPAPTVKKWKTIREAIGDLPEPPDDFREHPEYPNHYKTNITAINIERFSYVPEGGGWQDIPEEIRLPCHQDVDVTSGGWPDVYGRLRWDAQVPTITGGFDSFTRGRYGHPKANRAITPREAARLQGFPDWFRFHGNKSEVRAQLGNAVPVPLAEAIGKSIFHLLQVHDGLVKATSRRCALAGGSSAD